jgi:hypothetical protein
MGVLDDLACLGAERRDKNQQIDRLDLAKYVLYVKMASIWPPIFLVV